MMQQNEMAMREEIIDTCKELQNQGLVTGTTGNVSIRIDDGFLVSPTGLAYDALTPNQIVKMTWDGKYQGDVLPTSEWRLHRDILAARDDLNAIVHTHSTFATAVSIFKRDIPAIHYGIAAAGGPTIRCAGYATFGTQELSDLAVKALADRRACLLAHHGVISAHSSLKDALALAQTVEELAQLFMTCLPIGLPPILSDTEIARVMEKFATYGQ